MESVVSGKLLDKLFGRLAKIFDNALKDLAEGEDRDVKDVKEDSNGDLIATVLSEDFEPYMLRISDIKMNEEETEGTGYLSFKDPDGKVFENVLVVEFGEPETEGGQPIIVNDDDYEAAFNKFEYYMKQKYPLAASIKVKLQKVTGANEDIVELLNVYSNQSITCTLDSIDMFVSDDDNLSELPLDAPVVYDIVPCEDSIQVNEGDMPYSDDIIVYSCDQIIKEIWNTKWKSFACKHNIVGVEAEAFRSILTTLDWKLDEYMHTVANISIMHSGTINYFASMVNEDLGAFSISNRYCVSVIRDALEDLIASIDLLSCNFEEHEVGELRNIQHDLEAFLKIDLRGV